MHDRNVVLSEADFDRLNQLTHSRAARQAYGSATTGLEWELSRGEVVAPASVPANVVTMNSQVRVRELKGSRSSTYTLVYPRDADVDAGRLSVLAPLGKALLGAKEGDVVEVNAPAGVRKVKIERIVYQPEAAGDFHL